jgi:NADH-quinone oxidoreductase subunit E
MTDTTQVKSLLSPELRAKIEEWNKRYPPDKKASGVLQALHYAQEANGGSLTEEWMDAVADFLEMPHSAVYEVATFYTLYNLKPVGRHTISVCTNISCMLRGSEEIVDHLKKRLGVELKGTTPDGQFTLHEVECLGACIGAPMFQIGKEYYENLTPEKVDKILDGMKTSHG